MLTQQCCVENQSVECYLGPGHGESDASYWLWDFRHCYQQLSNSGTWEHKSESFFINNTSTFSWQGVDKIKKVVFLLYKPLFLNIKCEKSADNDNKSANIAFRGPKFCIGPLRLFPEEVGEKGKDENLPISITSLYVFQCR